MLSLATLALLAITAVRGDYTPEALADEVTSLPGAEKLSINFRQFSGYLDITETKHMHYWFVESSGNPEKDPVAFWTNGGKCWNILDSLGAEMNSNPLLLSPSPRRSWLLWSLRFPL